MEINKDEVIENEEDTKEVEFDYVGEYNKLSAAYSNVCSQYNNLLALFNVVVEKYIKKDVQ